MEDPRSVNSPRRTLSFSRNRRATGSFTYPDDKASGFGVSGEHGPKPSEVYGFVGSISTVVATGGLIFLARRCFKSKTVMASSTFEKFCILISLWFSSIQLPLHFCCTNKTFSLELWAMHLSLSIFVCFKYPRMIFSVILINLEELFFIFY